MSDPAFTGFYRIEYGLWHGQGARQLGGPAAKLRARRAGLAPGLAVHGGRPARLGLRTHEILENALEFQLTGHDDYGSGTTLATTAANITGTRELLTILRPLLVARYPGLPAVYAGLDKLDSLLEAKSGPAATGRRCARWAQTGVSRSTPPPGRLCRNSTRSRPSPSRGGDDARVWRRRSRRGCG